VSEIHPTAIVEKGAKLGKGCVVGPGAILGAEVELGEGCVVGARAVLEGRVFMGAKNRIGVGAVIGGEPQDIAYQGAKSGVIVGEGNIFREFVTVHRGTKEGTNTVIGNGCFLMVGAHVAHNCRLEDGVVLVNGVMLAARTRERMGFGAKEGRYPLPPAPVFLYPLPAPPPTAKPSAPSPASLP